MISTIFTLPGAQDFEPDYDRVFASRREVIRYLWQASPGAKQKFEEGLRAARADAS